MEHLFSSKNISSWTAGPNGISVDDPDDQRRLQDFLSTYGDMRKAIAAALGFRFPRRINLTGAFKPTPISIFPFFVFSIPTYTGMTSSAPKPLGQNPLRVSDVIRRFEQTRPRIWQGKDGPRSSASCAQVHRALGQAKNPSSATIHGAMTSELSDLSALIDAQRAHLQRRRWRGEVETAFGIHIAQTDPRFRRVLRVREG